MEQNMTSQKLYSEEEIKTAFYGRYYPKHPQDDEYQDRVTNAQWEMFLDYLKIEPIPPEDDKVFVFGSNESGIHGRGAALFARKYKGAVYGMGVGHVGNSYAIPTKDFRVKTLPLPAIKEYVEDFVCYAKIRQDLVFEVTRIGCGLAGYTDTDIAPMFYEAPDNCILPEGWKKVSDNT